jgi:hypothetical protein
MTPRFVQHTNTVMSSDIDDDDRIKTIPSSPSSSILSSSSLLLSTYSRLLMNNNDKHNIQTSRSCDHNNNNKNNNNNNNDDEHSNITSASGNNNNGNNNDNNNCIDHNNTNDYYRVHVVQKALRLTGTAVILSMVMIMVARVSYLQVIHDNISETFFQREREKKNGHSAIYSILLSVLVVVSIFLFSLMCRVDCSIFILMSLLTHRHSQKFVRRNCFCLPPPWPTMTFCC